MPTPPVKHAAFINPKTQHLGHGGIVACGVKKACGSIRLVIARYGCVKLHLALGHSSGYGNVTDPKIKTPKALFIGAFSVVPGTGIEPALSCENQILSLARLPIPPSGLFQTGCNITA
jgi:hypothetical protein